MKRQLFALGLACACSGAAFTAQEPPQAAEVVTIEGCLMREADVPGRRPIEGDRERVTRDDDYILTGSKVVKGAAPAAADERAGDPQPTGTSGTARMYKVEKLSVEQLHANRNQRVRLDGTFRYPDRAGNVVSPATDLVKLDATNVTALGPCEGSDR